MATASGQGEIEHRHCDGHRTQRRVFLERIQRAMAAQGRAHGAVFFSAGALAIVFAVLAMRNDMPDFLWGASCGGAAWILGPICLLIGGNAIVRSLRAQ